MEQSPWEASRSSASQEITRILMETEGSLPHSQSPVTYPYLQPDQSMPPHPTSRICILILSSHLYLGLTSGDFCIRSPHQNPVCTSPVFHSCHMPRRSHSSWFAHAKYSGHALVKCPCWEELWIRFILYLCNAQLHGTSSRDICFVSTVRNPCRYVDTVSCGTTCCAGCAQLVHDASFNTISFVSFIR